MQRIAFVLVPLVAGALYAQPAIESKSITLTVTKTVALQSADAQISVSIAGDLDTTMDQVLAAVKDLGLTAQDLTGLNSMPMGPRPDQFRLNYSFRLVVPFSRLKPTLDALDRLRRTIDTNLELQYYTIAVGASTAAFDEARQRALAELVQEAQRKAQSLADVSRLKLGPITAVSDSSASPGYPGSPGLQAYFTLMVRFAAEPLP
jgi:uncharacterized protein YggE